MSFEINLEVLGERIKTVREELGILQKDVAIMLDNLIVTINRLENGKGASIEVLFRYLNLLAQKGVNVPELFEAAFSKDRALRKNISDQAADESKVLNSFTRQIKDILSLQKDKSNKQYEDLINMTEKLSKLHMPD